jgi:hypothetical protein
MIKLLCSRVTKTGRRLGPSHDVVVTFTDLGDFMPMFIDGKTVDALTSKMEFDGRTIYSQINLANARGTQDARKKWDTEVLLREGIDMTEYRLAEYSDGWTLGLVDRVPFIVRARSVLRRIASVLAA